MDLVDLDRAFVRSKKNRYQVILPNAGATKIMEESNNRLAFWIWCNTASSLGCCVAPFPLTATAIGFIIGSLSQADRQLRMSIRTEGDLVRSEWWAFNNSGGQNIAQVVEILAEDCCLQGISESPYPGGK